MKILIVSQYFWPENFRITDAAVALQRRGHDVAVLTGVPSYPTRDLFAEYRKNPRRFAQIDGVTILRVPMLSRGAGGIHRVANYASYALNAAALGYWKLGKRRFDVILAYQISPATIGIPAVLLRRVKRAPLVFWVQDLWPESLLAIGVVKPGRSLRLVDRFVRWIYRNSDHVLGQSKSLTAVLAQRVPTGTPVSYVPNWPQFTPFPPRGPSSPSDTFDVYFIGNLGQAQDLPTVFEAIRRLREISDLRWHFVGDGVMSNWLREALVREGLADHVSFHGFVAPDLLGQFYAKADALLVSLKADPLFAMTLPSKLQSYLESGIPILAMLDGEGAEIVNASGAGFATPAGNSEKLADAVARLVGMTPEQRAKLGEAGQRYSAMHFQIEKIIDRLEAILNAEAIKFRKR